MRQSGLSSPVANKPGFRAASPVLPRSDVPSWQDLPIFRDIAAKIGVAEFRRRLIHMTPALLPFLLWYIPHRDPWGPLLINAALALTIVLVANCVLRFRTIARSAQEQGLGAAVGYAVPLLLLILLLPDRGELVVMTLGIIAMGDGSATLGGLWFGGQRLPWNPRKSISGLICFMVAGTFFATLFYWGEARPGVSWQTAFTVASVATSAAAFVESLPGRGNDNFRVASTAAIVGAAVQIVWLGR